MRRSGRKYKEAHLDAAVKNSSSVSNHSLLASCVRRRQAERVRYRTPPAVVQAELSRHTHRLSVSSSLSDSPLASAAMQPFAAAAGTGMHAGMHAGSMIHVMTEFRSCTEKKRDKQVQGCPGLVLALPKAGMDEAGPAGSESELVLRVKMLDGREIQVAVPRAGRIADVAEKVLEAEDAPMHKMIRLIYGGRLMQPEDPIAVYNIGPQVVIHAGERRKHPLNPALGLLCVGCARRCAPACAAR